MDVLARRLLAGLKNAAFAAVLHGARCRTLQFFEGLYMDLHHLAGNLAIASSVNRITDACHDVQRVIHGQEARSPIIAEGHTGSRMAPARGISIYFRHFWIAPRSTERSTSRRRRGARTSSRRISAPDGRARGNEGPRSLGRGW